MKSQPSKKILNLVYSIKILQKQEGENERLKDKIKLLETENKILKNDIATKEILILSFFQLNNILQQEGPTTELLTPTSENSCKDISKM